VLHPIVLLLLAPGGVLFALLRLRGQDTAWIRLGTERRFAATGHEPPHAWREAEVRARLDELERTRGELEASLQAEAQTPPEETARVADLEPGDALFIPSMWWHHVEADGPFNILVNYWWRTVERHLGTPQDVLNHAMMTLRDLPARERRIWKDLFDHYVFESDESVRAHIPEHARGILGPMTAAMTRRVRAFLLDRLNR